VSLPPAYPITALVGHDDLRLALMLCAIDPAIGGVLVRGEKGSGKTTAARGLAGVLPGHAPFVELPLGASEDRVVGSLDLRAALGSGEYRFQPGLLSQADGGVLYVDEVNLLADHLVDVLLDAAATGINRVERDGVSHVHASRFVLVGSMNPEEGELRPQLLDRFGLSVEVGAPKEPEQRAEAIRRRMAFDAEPEAFVARWRKDEDRLRGRLGAARPAVLEDRIEERVAELCHAAGAEGLRADLVICRAAAALAGYLGRDVAGVGEVRRVAALALAHRRHTPWDGPKAPGSSLDEVLDQAFGGADPVPGRGGAAPVPQDAAPAPLEPPDVVGEGRREPPTDPGVDPAVMLAARVDPLTSGPRTALDHQAGRGRRAVEETKRGRVVGARVPGPEPLGGLAMAPTVEASVARGLASGTLAPGGPLGIGADDLRETVRRSPLARLVVFLVDTSGSMGVERRIELVRRAVTSLLADAYRRRDRVAVVAFRNRSAEVVLQPTGSIEVAKVRLATLARGGRTPLATGLEEALRLAQSPQHHAMRPVIVVASDGHATYAPAGGDPVAASLAVAARIRRAGLDTVVIDCESAARGTADGLGLAAALADALGAARIGVDELGARIS
jgi:magnesium chelatase subunit D